MPGSAWVLPALAAAPGGLCQPTAPPMVPPLPALPALPSCSLSPAVSHLHPLLLQQLTVTSHSLQPPCPAPSPPSPRGPPGGLNWSRLPVPGPKPVSWCLNGPLSSFIPLVLSLWPLPGAPTTAAPPTAASPSPRPISWVSAVPWLLNKGDMRVRPALPCSSPTGRVTWPLGASRGWNLAGSPSLPPETVRARHEGRRMLF